MKKTVLLFTFLLSVSLAAQRNGMSYQALILNPNGEDLPGVNNDRAPLINQNVCLQFSISPNSQLEYVETIQTTTDAYGMVNVVIGTGTQIGGSASSWDSINWSSEAKSLIVGLDTEGNCSNFEQISNQPLTSVPFALYSPSSEIPGPEGLSAYEVWLELGNTGSEQDFIDSLTGPVGVSAYNTWLSLGNTGSEQDFIDSLTGPEGVSAYSTWLSLGNTGSKQDFIDSLTGPQGEQGAQGSSGQSSDGSWGTGCNYAKKVNLGEYSSYSISTASASTLTPDDTSNTISEINANKVNLYYHGISRYGRVVIQVECFDDAGNLLTVNTNTYKGKWGFGSGSSSYLNSRISYSDFTSIVSNKSYTALSSDSGSFLGYSNDIRIEILSNSMISEIRIGYWFSSKDQNYNQSHSYDISLYKYLCSGPIINGATETTEGVGLIGSTPIDIVSTGEQIWTKKNMDIATYRDGTLIPQVTDPTEWKNLITGAWCYVGNDANTNEEYGKLYNWYAIAGIHDDDSTTMNKTFAPAGWHVPTKEEYIQLFQFLIVNGYAWDGDVMANPNSNNKLAKSLAASNETNLNYWGPVLTTTYNLGQPQFYPSENNKSLMNFIPAGYRNTNGTNLNENRDARYWTNSVSTVDANNALSFGIFKNNVNSSILDALKVTGRSVRLVKD